MTEIIKHECGIAMVRLLKPLSYYQKKYGSYLYGLNKLYLLMEKQHNRGQEGAGLACVKLHARPAEEFIYREYTVMQPLQRSYAITEERIETMLSKGSLSALYDQSKVDELENAEELTGKDQKKLEAYQANKPGYDAIVATLKAAVSEQIYNCPAEFAPVLSKALSAVTADKKLLEKIADGLSVMDKNAEIQRDRKGSIIYDKETKDTEQVKWEENIEDYMAREVLPHIPDAAAFFEENLSAKKPVIKTGAEIPFTRYFYKYQPSTPSEELENRFKELELSVTERVAKLFG